MSQETIEKKLAYLEETKHMIGDALVTKGQTLDSETPFRDYVQKVLDIETGYDTRDATAVASEVLKGKTFYNSQGKVEGTLVPKTGDIKKFETIEEMQNDENALEGDLAVVYREDMQNWDGSSAITSLTFPKVVVLPSTMTGYCYGYGSGSTWLDFNGDISSSNANFDLMGNEYYHITYTSTDGITYTRTDSYDETLNLSEEPLTIDMFEWSDVCGYFMQVGGKYLEGLYEYMHTPITSGHPALHITKEQIINTITDNVFTNPNNIMYVLPNYSEISSVYGSVVIRESKSLRFYKDSNGNDIELREITKATIYDPGRSLVEYQGNIYVGDDASYPAANLISGWNKGTYEIDNGSVVFNKYTNASQIPVSISIGSYYKNCVPITDTDMIIGFLQSSYNTEFENYILVEGQTNIKHLTDTTETVIDIINPVINVQEHNYKIAPTQLTLVDENEILPGKVAYGKNGIVEGNESIYDNLNFEDLWKYYNIIPESTTSKLKVFSSDIPLTPVISYNANENGLSYIYINSGRNNFPYIVDEEVKTMNIDSYWVKISNNEVMQINSQGNTVYLHKYILNNEGIVTITTYDTLSNFSYSGTYKPLIRYSSKDNCLYIINPSSNQFKFYKYALETKTLTLLFDNSSLDLNVNYASYNICLDNNTIFVCGRYTGFIALTFDGSLTKIADVSHTLHSSNTLTPNYSSTYMLTYNGDATTAKLYNMKTKSYTNITFTSFQNCVLYDNDAGDITYAVCEDLLYKIQNDEIISTTALDINTTSSDSDGNVFKTTSTCTSLTSLPMVFNDRIYGKSIYIDTITDIAYIDKCIPEGPFVLYHSGRDICTVGSTARQYVFIDIVEDNEGERLAFINNNKMTYNITKSAYNTIKTNFTLKSITTAEYQEALETAYSIRDDATE